jgi:hypothetical protein
VPAMWGSQSSSSVSFYPSVVVGGSRRVASRVPAAAAATTTVTTATADAADADAADAAGIRKSDVGGRVGCGWS